MQKPYEIAPDTFVLPLNMKEEGFGVLYLRAGVIRGKEPVLVDTGSPIHRGEYFEQAFSIVEPKDVRWIWLSHDDRDHSGNLMQALDMCPNAKVITNFIGLGRLQEEWQLPMDRLMWVNDGDSFSIGDRTLTAIRPPLFDSPSTRGLWDPKTRTYFSVDSFSAIVPEECEESREAPADKYEEGFFWFNSANHPWHALADAAKLEREIDRIRRLDALHLVSTHGPHATGRTAELCDLLSRVISSEPQAMPGQADLEQILAQMALAEAAPGL